MVDFLLLICLCQSNFQTQPGTLRGLSKTFFLLYNSQKGRTQAEGLRSISPLLEEITHTHILKVELVRVSSLDNTVEKKKAYIGNAKLSQ